MAKSRKKIEVFSLSFLDCICCGFGAVILLFVITNARSEAIRQEITVDLTSEVDRMEREVRVGKKGLVEIKNSLEEKEDEIVTTQGEAARIIKLIEERKEELADMDKTTLATKEHVNKLKSDIQSLEEEVKRLQAASLANDDKGQDIKKVKGVGDRQYLTGMKIGGRHILIMVDASASMLGDKVVEIIRRRNAGDRDKLASKKWQQAVRTVDWLTSQIPAGSNLQIYTFNETAKPLVKEVGGDWLDGSDPLVLEKCMDELRKVIPQKGTSMHQVYLAMRDMQPKPDNVILLIDGLPTMDSKSGLKKTVSAGARLKFFERAEKLRPQGIPMNIIMYAMEGDPMAAQAFWRVAQNTKGSFFCPSKDWP